MKAKFFVSLTSALALMIFSLNGAHAVGPARPAAAFWACNATRAVLSVQSRHMRLFRREPHMHQKAAVLLAHFPSGLRLRRQDLRQ
jgi:hypothetical protein